MMDFQTTTQPANLNSETIRQLGCGEGGWEGYEVGKFGQTVTYDPYHHVAKIQG